MKDTRPDNYLYYKQLLKHVGGDCATIFNGQLIYQRQFEIHLPGNRNQMCTCACTHCNGKLYERGRDTWEIAGIELLENLKGKIPYHIYGGVYTEPTLNPYLMTYLALTKKYNNHFGIHTNGSQLGQLEKSISFLTELNRISTDNVDYLSISLDAGSPESWSKTKNNKNPNTFYDILDAIRLATKIRDKKGNDSHAIRMTYLITPTSNNLSDFENVIKFAKDTKVDSLRFSIPYANYNQDFKVLKEYNEEVEISGDNKYHKILEPYLSKNKKDIPYIFYTSTDFIDYKQFNFKQCVYGYYQITYAADGYAYKCSAAAAPDAAQCRLGKITADIPEFERMVMKNLDGEWDAQKMCFDKKIRCNRMGIEISQQYKQWKEESA